jgi:hypothetical protein
MNVAGHEVSDLNEHYFGFLFGELFKIVFEGGGYA